MSNTSDLSLLMYLNLSTTSILTRSLPHISNLGAKSVFHILKITLLAIIIPNNMACLSCILNISKLLNIPRIVKSGHGSRFFLNVLEKQSNMFSSYSCNLRHNHSELRIPLLLYTCYRMEKPLEKCCVILP